MLLSLIETTYSPSTHSTITSGTMYLVSCSPANCLPGLRLQSSDDIRHSLDFLNRKSHVSCHRRKPVIRNILQIFIYLSLSVPSADSCRPAESGKHSRMSHHYPTPAGSNPWIMSSTCRTFSSGAPVASAISSTVEVIYPFSSRDSIIYLPTLLHPLFSAAN